MSPLETDLLDHIITGRTTHHDGAPIAWGAWMSVCLESLEARGFVVRERFAAGVVYSPTEAGRAALANGDGG
ncbi:hypothetical protein [Ancylobacter sp.]|uniref:hypothetical protein n=1 Tax=Ancylobacter sp. TaxID=1872567 RepID=UPI003D14D7D2